MARLKVFSVRCDGLPPGTQINLTPVFLGTALGPPLTLIASASGTAETGYPLPFPEMFVPYTVVSPLYLYIDPYLSTNIPLFYTPEFIRFNDPDWDLRTSAMTVVPQPGVLPGPTAEVRYKVLPNVRSGTPFALILAPAELVLTTFVGILITLCISAQSFVRLVAQSFKYAFWGDRFNEDWLDLPKDDLKRPDDDSNHRPDPDDLT